MGFNDINLQVSGPQQPASIYKTKVLKGQVPFAVQVTEPNTKYVIKHNFVLNGDVTIPENCILEFDGGSISASGSNDTITGANTGINAGLVKILNTDVTLSGTWNVVEAYPEWFGAKGNGTTDDSVSINKVINLPITNDINIVFSNKTYLVTPDVIIIDRDNVRLSGNNTTIITNESETYRCLIFANNRSNIIIENLTFNTLGDTTVVPIHPETDKGCKVIIMKGTNALVKDCDFYFYGVHAIAFLTTKHNIKIENNRLFFVRKGEVVSGQSYDCSGLYIDAGSSEIKGNYIDGQYNNEDVWLQGGIEAHGDMYSVENNTIKNCHIGLNLVNHDPNLSQRVSTNGKESKIVSLNTINYVRNGIIIWPIANSHPVENLHILNNSILLIERGASGIGNSNETGDINNLVIDGNIISRDGEEPGYPENNSYKALINFYANCPISNLQITNNTLINAPRAAIWVQPSNEEATFDSVIIKNNLFKDCSATYHSSGSDYVASYQYDVIYCENIENIVINNNNFVFNISVSLLNNIAALPNCKGELLYNKVICLYKNTSVSENYFEDMCNCDIDIKSIKTDFIAYIDYERTDNPSEFKYTEDIVYTPKICRITQNIDYIPYMCFHRGDTIINVTTGRKWTFAGNYNNMSGGGHGGYIFSSSPKIYVCNPRYIGDFYLGDALSISDAEGGSTIKHTISKIVGNYIYFAENINLYDGVRDVSAVGYMDAKDVIVDYPLKSGTFAQKPKSTNYFSIPVGYKYFCTDKQTTEGATNGIEILFKERDTTTDPSNPVDIWVDALGRVVS